MKKLVLFIMVAMVAMVSLTEDAYAFFGKKNKNVEWKLGHNANTDHIWHKTSVKFADLVAEKSEGKMTVKVFANGQLGSETDMINSVR